MRCCGSGKPHVSERAVGKPERAGLTHLIGKNARGSDDLRRRALRIHERQRATEPRELLDHRRFLRRVRRYRAREISNRRRAVFCDRPTRIALRARQSMQTVRDKQPHRIRTPKIRTIRVPAQISAVRLERRLERKHSISTLMYEREAKIDARALSHKDRACPTDDRVMLHVLTETRDMRSTSLARRQHDAHHKSLGTYP